MLGNDHLIWKKFIVSFQNIFWVKFKLIDRSLGILFNIACCWLYKGNNKITELRTILQRESQNS